MKKTIIWIIVIGLVAALGVYYYSFHYAAKHDDPLESSEKVDITAEKLFALYSRYEDSANKLYLDKTISVSGQISTVEQNENRYTVTFQTNDSNGAVICEMDTLENRQMAGIRPNSNINVVGFCNGLLIDVQLDRCRLAK
jgi:hypothetical protein